MLTLEFSFPWEEARANWFLFHSIKKNYFLKNSESSDSKQQDNSQMVKPKAGTLQESKKNRIMKA